MGFDIVLLVQSTKLHFIFDQTSSYITIFLAKNQDVLPFSMRKIVAQLSDSKPPHAVRFFQECLDAVKRTVGSPRRRPVKSWVERG